MSEQCAVQAERSGHQTAAAALLLDTAQNVAPSTQQQSAAHRQLHLHNVSSSNEAFGVKGSKIVSKDQFSRGVARQHKSIIFNQFHAECYPGGRLTLHTNVTSLH